MKKLISILLVTGFVFSGCAFSEDEVGLSPQAQREQAEKEKLLSTYRTFSGKYVGYLQTANLRQEVELNITTLEEKLNATNPDGTDRFRVVLRASFKRLNPVGDYFFYVAKYTVTTGGLVLTTTDERQLQIGAIHTMNLLVRGENITGFAESLAGTVGQLELGLVSRQASVSGNGEQEEREELLRQQFARVAGVYEGTVEQPNGKSYEVMVNLYLFEETVGGEKTQPRLKGIFHRVQDRDGVLDYDLANVVYRPDLKPVKLTMTGSSKIATNGYQVVFNGTLEGDIFEGTMTSNIKGFEGQLRLKKKQ